MDNVIFFKTEEEFQDWLSGHYRQTTEIWGGVLQKEHWPTKYQLVRVCRRRTLFRLDRWYS
ncbi:hypothetical protein [Vibrio genomosp. F10]|uniref:hypothetical protein n=1 Tax=Vibrio genomosp. F10 TaxID=723171 RepID=UPI001F529737|nr:hypothetical protein [Vibrio genomosp. F10]